jgi:4-hydroxybenzoate polyprenyltransferase
VSRLVGAVRLVHPFPSALNAVVTACLALVAGGETRIALGLAAGMLGFQCSIGAVNDLVDEPADREVKPWKPIPAGLVTRRGAVLVAGVAAAVGVILSAAAVVPTLAVGIAGYGCGLAYNLVLRRRGLGWVAYCVAFPLAIAYPWVGVTGALPPRLLLLVPVAALAGPALHLANGLVDAEEDRSAGQQSLVTRLGRRGSLRVAAFLTAAVYLVAWATLLASEPVPEVAIGLAVAATILAAAGVAGSASGNRRARSAGWMAQAVGIGTLAVAWFAAVSTAPLA